MCRAVLESQETTAAAEGINNGIVYLMLFPYLLVGGVGYVVYKNAPRKGITKRSYRGSILALIIGLKSTLLY